MKWTGDGEGDVDGAGGGGGTGNWVIIMVVNSRVVDDWQVWWMPDMSAPSA